MPPRVSSSTPRIIVAPDSDRPVRGDEPTAHAALFEGETPRAVARSAVPKLPTRPGSRYVTVDPRRFLGEKSELWTFSLDVHKNLASLVARIWKSLRRAGAKVPPMTYGAEWVLFEPRTARFVADDAGEAVERMSLETAGIRPGTILWVMAPEGRAREKTRSDIDEKRE